jgi:hypothetical protein
MQSMVANEATICCKEQISIGTGQTRQHVESYAVNGREDRSGETGLQEELDPMSIVIVRHRWLFYSSSLVPLYTTCSLQDESLWKPQNNNAEGEEITNVGLINTIGEGVERPGRSSSQIQGIRSL